MSNITRSPAIILLVLGIIVAAVLAFASLQSKPQESTTTLKVGATTFVLEDFVKKVGGENVEVFNPTPSGVEAHEFEPTLNDVARMQNSDVLVFHGAGLDPWAEKIASELLSSGVRTVKMTENLDLFQAAEGEKQSDFDPHIWMDPILAIGMVEKIRDALVSEDSNHASEYQTNAANFIEELQNLDRDIQKGLTDCKLDTIVVSHHFLQYFASRYNLTVVSVAGISPDQEPSLKEFSEITAQAKKLGVQYLLVETLVSPGLSETIAQEIGGGTLPLHSIEGLTPNDAARGETYLSLQRSNLQNMRRAMECPF